MSRIGLKLIHSNLSYRLSKYSRGQKMRLLREFIVTTNAKSVLDIGVGAEWEGAQNTLHEAKSEGFININRLVACGVEDLTNLRAKYKKSIFVYGNGLTLPFESNAFDIAYSNAVIEHVFPVNERLNFVKEMLRVAKCVFITTPNKWFPIEVHSRLPFVHWMPASLNNKILKLVGLSQLSRGSYFEPLNIRDLSLCFPENVIPEIRLGFLRMTIIAQYNPGT